MPKDQVVLTLFLLTNLKVTKTGLPIAINAASHRAEAAIRIDFIFVIQLHTCIDIVELYL